MTRLRLICVLTASLPLLGCPQSGTGPAPSAETPPATDVNPPAGGQVQQQQQTPTSKPASRPAGHADGQPEAPKGPKLTFALNPERTVAPRIDVKLERMAILPMTAENIEAEPIKLEGLFQPSDKHYVAIVLRVTVDGKPWSEIDDGTGVEKIGPFAIELPDQIVNINGTALSDPEQPDLAYLYRVITPPISKPTRFAFRAILALEEGHTLLARFNDLQATAPKPAAPDDGKQDETPADPPKDAPKDDGGK